MTRTFKTQFGMIKKNSFCLATRSSLAGRRTAGQANQRGRRSWEAPFAVDRQRR